MTHDLANRSAREAKPNARSFERLPKTLRCQLVREHDFSLVSSELCDISETGARAILTQPLLTGEELILCLTDDRGRIFVDAEAEVVRVSHGRRRHDRIERARGVRTVGLVFTRLFDKSEASLEMLLMRWRQLRARHLETLGLRRT
jgi:PilZ domain